VSSGKDNIDWFLPLPAAPGVATHMRGTWLTASQATIRERGLGQRYEAAIASEHREAVLSVVAGVWVPMDVVRAHYLACDALGLPEEDLVDIGAAAARRANATHLAFIARLAQGAGVTPWTIMAQFHRAWTRMCDGGGAVGVQKRGPKEARVLVVGYPLAAMRYNRVTMRGIAAGFLEMFCEKAYVKEIPSYCDARSIGLRVSWA
jgi:hypothetical protein